MNGLYVITTENRTLGRTHIDVCKAALEGGASIIQYRCKRDIKELIDEALEIKKLCEKHCATFIVNDWLELAIKVDADGLHLGQNDEQIIIARKKFPNKIIGLSASNLNEALQAEILGADYIGAGPVFNTPSKDDASPPFGLYELTKINRVISVPIVAIGGINKENANAVLKAGADAIAVISAISAQEDMTKATKELIQLYEPTAKY